MKYLKQEKPTKLASSSHSISTFKCHVSGELKVKSLLQNRRFLAEKLKIVFHRKQKVTFKWKERFCYSSNFRRYVKEYTSKSYLKYFFNENRNLQRMEPFEMDPQYFESNDSAASMTHSASICDRLLEARRFCDG